MSSPVPAKSPVVPQKHELRSLSRPPDILRISILGFALGLTAAWAVFLAHSFVRLVHFAI